MPRTDPHTAHTPSPHRTNDIAILTSPVQLTSQIIARWAMINLASNLLDSKATSEQVNRHADLHTPTRRKRISRLYRLTGQATLTGQRLLWLPPGEPLNPPLGKTSHNTVTTGPHLRRQVGDRHIDVARQNRIDQGCALNGGIAQIGVEKKDGARDGVFGVAHRNNRGARLHGRSLTPVNRMPYDCSAGGAGD